MRFLPLLVGSILVNWLAAKYYVATKQAASSRPRSSESRGARHLQVHEFLRRDVPVVGLAVGPFAIALPLGISFFTFHHIMYLVDLRRGKAPNYPLDRYALYIAFFPQAIAGAAGALVAR